MFSKHYGTLFSRNIIFNNFFNFSRRYSGHLHHQSCNLSYDSMGYLKILVNEPFSEIKYCKKKSCEYGEFFCSINKYCISIEQVCDGINHCWNNEDELNCGASFKKKKPEIKNNNFNIIFRKLLQIFTNQEDILSAKIKINILRSIKFVMEMLTAVSEMMKFIAQNLHQIVQNYVTVFLYLMFGVI